VSPDGKRIVYQRKLESCWRLFLYDVDHRLHHPLHVSGEATDATFSPDSREILYSGEFGESDGALLAVPIAGGTPRLIADGGYHGAPSWSPDGRLIACETGPGDPDGGPGTKLAIISV
jgi:TolB protein